MKLKNIFKNGDGGLATQAQLRSPDGLAHEANGNLFIADRGNRKIRVLAVAPTFFDIDPDVMNTNAQGKFSTVYLEFPDELNHGPEDVNVSSVSVLPQGPLSFQLAARLLAFHSPSSVVDHNNNGVLERMTKYDREIVQSWVDFSEALQLRIDGQFIDGRYFTSTETIRFFTPPSQEEPLTMEEETF
jgi:hypothetical protein